MTFDWSFFHMGSIYDRSVQLIVSEGKMEFSVLGSGNRFEIEDPLTFLSFAKECMKNEEYSQILELFNVGEKSLPSGTSNVCIASFLRFYRENVYHDYSNFNEVKNWDIKKSREDFENNLIKYSVDVQFDNRGRVKDAPNKEVEHIVDSCFRPVSKSRFYDIYDVYLTPVPSNGARHPLYPIFLIQGKLYIYSIRTDDFIVSDSMLNIDRDLFFLVCNFEVVQVRYPDSTAFNDVLLEIGHMITNLKLKGSSEGFCLKRYKIDSYQSVLKLYEYEEVMECFEILNTNKEDGIENIFAQDIK